jgi:HSP20 family protein
MTKKSKEKSTHESHDSGLGGIFGGLADLIEKLGDLADKGKELRGSGEFEPGGSKELKGIYGFNVRVGLGDKGDKKVKVEPFGNIKKDRQSGETFVQEVREPLADIFEEEDHTLIVAEMPGIGEKDVKLAIHDDVLTIRAERGDKRYRKEVLLPKAYRLEDIKISCNNGMLELKCVN